MAHLKIKTEKGLQYIGDKRIDDITVAGVLTTDGNGNLESKELDNNFQRPLDKFSGIVKQTLAEDGTNSFSAAVANEDFQPPLNEVNGILKSNNDRQISQATPNVDYMEPPTVIDQNGSSLSIMLSHNKVYNLTVSANGLLTLNSGLGGTAETPDISISHGFIQFEGPATVNFGAFLSIKGSDDISGATATITTAKLWEFSSLNGYLIIKDWSED